jgi:hypothetical protein
VTARRITRSEEFGGGEMSARRWITTLSFMLVMLGVARSPARAIDLRFEPSILGQVRDGDGYFDGSTEFPAEIYGDAGLSNVRHGMTLDTYFRLEDDFAHANNAEGDFFSGVLRLPAARPGLDLQLGRQIVAESPVGIWDADSGQIRLNLGNTPFSVTAFGGQPRYWEPIYGPDELSQDEQIFGGSVRMTPYRGGAVALGYLQQIRKGEELMQQVTLSGTRAFRKLPGLPSLYGNFAFDADRANIDRVRAGVQSFVWRPNLLLNFESGYYKPQDNGRILVRDINRREDAIFQGFSLSEQLQFRGGLRYNLSRSLSTYGDLSYQRYQQTRGNYVNGYVWSTGVLYQPGGDGLEMVRVEYYGIDSAGGTVNGGRISYENRVYENILFRATCDVAYYDKASNQDGTAVGSLIGLGYQFLPGLVAELNFEGNKNQFFPEDFRFGFFITYGAVYSKTPGSRVQRSYAAQGRPWVWGPPRFGPAAWGPVSADWTANPGMPAGGWAASTFQSESQRPGGAPATDGAGDAGKAADGGGGV